LKIIEKRPIRQSLYFHEQMLVKHVGLVRIAPHVQQNERLPQFLMLGLPGAELVQNHHARKDQQSQEGQDKPILSQKNHPYGVR
jgi:hypothetical protein